MSTPSESHCELLPHFLHRPDLVVAQVFVFCSSSFLRGSALRVVKEVVPLGLRAQSAKVLV